MNNPKLTKCFKQVYSLLLDYELPDYLCNFSYHLDDDKYLQLQDFCSNHSKIDWLPGIAILEAADSIVKEAMINNNILENGEYDSNFMLTWKYNPEKNNI